MERPTTIAIEVPVLETGRLRLRGHRPEDFEKSVAMWGDTEVVRFVGGRPLTREEVWARVLRYAGHWAWMGYGFWLVEEKETGEFVGEVGYGNNKRDIEPSLNGLPELGWVLARTAHGKGYATEAVSAAMDWGEVRKGWSKTVCIIDPENVRSVRVAEKCGFREWGLGTYRGEATLVLARERPADRQKTNLRKSNSCDDDRE